MLWLYSSGVRTEEPLAFLGRYVRDVAVRQLVPDHQLAALVQRLVVEQVDVRVEEAAQQRPARSQHPEGLPPHRGELGDEQVRDRVEDEVERRVGERGQAAHVAEHRPQRQAVPLGDQLVLLELARRVVQHGDPGPGCGERRALLAAAGGQAQHVRAGQVGG
jgi:hypothetical protein